MATGTRTTYTDTGIIKRGIGDVIKMIDWTEAPLLNLLGTKNESKFRLQNYPNTKVEWMEDTMSARAGTVNEPLDNSETGVDLASGEGALLKTGDVMKVDDELMYVSSVTGDTATVTRGFAGTTAATHNTAVAWTLATVARLEGADFTTGHTTTITLPFNYTQILSEAVKVTGSEQKNSKYGISDTLAYHVSKLIGGGTGIGSKGKAGKLAILLEQSFYHGMRAIGSDSTPRSMGGFNQYVTNANHVLNLASASLTRKHIEDKIQTIYEAGGTPDTIVCDAWARRKITSFYEGTIRTERSEERGGSRIDTIITDFGEVEVMYGRWGPPGNLYILEKDKCGWITYRDWDIYDRASTGDYLVKDILGEFSFVLCNEKSFGRLYGYSTTT